MFMFFFAFSVAVVASGDRVFNCTNYPFEECNVPQVADIPGSKEEMKVFCPVLKKYLECLHDYEEYCREEEMVYIIFRDEEQYGRAINLVDDICDESTLLYEAVSENMKCIKNSLQNYDEACGHEKDTVREGGFAKAIIEYISSLPDTDDEDETKDDFRAITGCLSEAYAIACYTGSVTRKCGDLAGDAVMEIFKRSDWLPDYCLENQSDYIDLFHSLALEDKERNLLRALFERK